ncbi:MAG TPA: rod shape-determining protein MreD [Gemmatimonadaceae bacterium]|nr:rod shape-determining protein MreD [Gemmatimonadaceae bacterium]
MTLGGTVRALITFLILVLLHYTLRPLLGWRAPMDFLVLALLLASIRVRPAVAALIGLAMGLVADSLTPDSLGAAAIAMTIVGYLASWLKAVFFADNLALNAFFFFLGKWIFDLIYFLVEQRLGGIELVQQLVLWSPLSAAATAAAGIVLILIMRPMLEPSHA